MPGVVVVTDSTASLPADVADALGIVVVPLQVVIGAKVYDEGADGATPELVAQALRDFVPVSTSRPAPAALAQLYERLAAEGADAIVSVHLSGEMSGTFESAQLAAREVEVPVHCVDSRQVGIATGFAALSAVEVLARGGSAEEAAAAARARAAEAASLFYVDTLEYLRRGGRIGAAAAILGGALSVKPLLNIQDGKVANLERVRTAARALSRLEDLAVEAAGDRAVDVCVSHLANPERAAQLAQRLSVRLADNLAACPPGAVTVADDLGDASDLDDAALDGGREVWCGELGAVLGAHVGPGMVAVCVSPLVDDAPAG